MFVYRHVSWHVSWHVSCYLVVVGLFSLADPARSFGQPAPGAKGPLTGTEELTWDGDIAARLVDGVDRFLLREIELSTDRRSRHWHRDFSSPEAYTQSLEPNRQRLAHILGVRDPRVPFQAPESMVTVDQSGPLAEGEGYQIFAVRWPVVRDVTSEGLLIVPSGRSPIGNVICVPDADVTPEQFCAEETRWSQSPVRYARQGYRVIVPTLISRRMVQRNGRATLSQREFLYRSAFELGRHILGYEVQKILASVDWFDRPLGDRLPVAVYGYGEGGLLALFATAIDTRIDRVEIEGCFGTRNLGWREGIDRNVFGLLDQFGDAELASMVAPRPLVVLGGSGPEIELSGAGGGAPAEWTDDPTRRNSEINRARALTASLSLTQPWLSQQPINSPDQREGFAAPQYARTPEDPLAREDRLVHQIERDTQWLLRESPYVRAEFMKKIDTKSLAAFEKSIEAYRETFRKDVIGAFDYPFKPFQARTRLQYETNTLVGYEVVLDVWDDVIAYGVLLLPKDLKPGERRPVVVCQHGLEGRPSDTIQGDHPAYHDFAAKLCERGFITFAPQNLYIGRDRFRTLQRKANPLGKTLFSIIVPQHQQVVNWLKQQAYVDPGRIGFYGLSYGGKSAMRIPPLVKDYCLSICSADFNEWVAKNASTRLPFSYVWTNEYEIFEWDLGSTFNYAEMAALIAPRPFMVERGHTDGVSTDEWVAFEYAKVFNLYSHRLKIPDRCQMEVFDGPHTINGKGTFEFLHRHLNWPKR
jgi:dienelactone hydrolase